MKPVKDVAGLPRILLIGDSISIGYTVGVRELLSGKAPPEPEALAADQLAISEIDEILGVRRKGNLIFCKGNDEGLEKIDIFLERFKDSPLCEKALYVKAISLWGMHRYAEAAPVYGEFLAAWPAYPHPSEPGVTRLPRSLRGRLSGRRVRFAAARR